MSKLNLNLPKRPVGRPRKDAIQYDKAEAFDLTNKLKAGNIAENMMASLFKAAPKKRGRPPKIPVGMSPAAKQPDSDYRSSVITPKELIKPKIETESEIIDKVDNQFIKDKLDAPFKFSLAAETDARYIKLLNYAKIKTVTDYNEKSNVIGFLIGYMSQHPELEEQLRKVESKMDDYVDEYKKKESIMNVFEKVKKERRSERNQAKKAAKKQM